MEKITFKPGLEYQDDYFYISDPEIASCFLAVDVDGDITYSVNQITYETLASEKSCSLKIHKSGVAEQLKPVKGGGCFWWEEDHIKPIYDPNYNEYYYELSFVVKASALTLNIKIEMLNQLMEICNG